MKRGHTRRLALAVGVVAAIVVASSAAWIGSQRATASSGAVATQGRRERDPAHRDDELHRLVQPLELHRGPGAERDGHDLSAAHPARLHEGKEGYFIVGRLGEVVEGVATDGKTWTFKLRPNGEVVRRTSDDRRRRRVDDQHDHQVRGRARLPCRRRRSTTRREATAPNSTTLVVNYDAPVANALWLLAGLPIVPRHVWEPLEKKEKAGGGAQDVPPAGQPADGHGRRVHGEAVREEGHDAAFIPDPNFYGPKSNADAVALTYYTNADSMIADLRQGNARLDRPGAVQRRERGQEEQGRQGQRVARRGDHEHHVELEPAQARRTASSSTRG